MSESQNTVKQRIDNGSWRRETFYQIYPMSFCDSNGDGIGDIPGIISKLDYLKDLGVGYLWLTPIYPSPGYDNGYDVSDYRSVDSKFGTLEDLTKLFDEAHARDIGVIMDMVVNHTSTDHEWFRRALTDPSGPYRDYYIWRDPVGSNPPNNWLSKFGGSAWEFDKTSGQFYLHLYDKHQADLNWENPRVRQEVADICLFWAEKGIDGFRLDVINNISKDPRFLDDTFETPLHDGRSYYSDGPRVHEYLHELNQRVFEPYGLITVGEMSSTTPEHCIRYTRSDSRELSMTFNFHHMKVDYPNGEKWKHGVFDLVELKTVISTWQSLMIEGGGWNALFWTNHDQPRAIGRFLSDDERHRETSAKNLAILEFGLCGTTFIFQGEEIALKNAAFRSKDDFEDVESLNAIERLIEDGLSIEEAVSVVSEKSRDNSRTPMRWNNGRSHGFTSGTPWYSEPEGNEYPANADAARATRRSIWHTYRTLIDFRKKSGVLENGSFKLLDRENKHVFAYMREDHTDQVAVISNFTPGCIHFTNEALSGKWTVVAGTHLNNGRSTSGPSFNLKPYEAMMLTRIYD